MGFYMKPILCYATRPNFIDINTVLAVFFVIEWVANLRHESTVLSPFSHKRANQVQLGLPNRGAGQLRTNKCLLF